MSQSQKNTTPEVLSLWVSTAESDNEKYKVNVKRTTKLRKVMTNYVERAGGVLESFRFLYDGASVSEDSTPQELGMEDGDTLEVRKEVARNKLVTATATAKSANLDDTQVIDQDFLRQEEQEQEQGEDDTLSLVVRSADGTAEIQVKQKKTANFRELKLEFVRKVLKGKHLRPDLRYLYDGVRISNSATPEEMEMENGDVIEVHGLMDGGARSRT